MYVLFCFHIYLYIKNEWIYNLTYWKNVRWCVWIRYINKDIAINARVFLWLWVEDYIIFLFLIYERQRKSNSAKRNLFWKLTKKRLRSSWKLCLFHQQGLCLLLWLLIKQGWTRWLFIQTTAISRCGNIFLIPLAIHPKIMSSGLLLLSFWCYYPLDDLSFIILTTLS